jgi:DNA-binding transcriptional LysR family regulator
VEHRLLQTFVAVAEELHFGRAADRLHSRQPVVSDQVRRLEAELGVLLFARTSRRVELTIAGRELLPRAQLILDQTEEARQAIGRLREGSEGTIRWASTPLLAPELGPFLSEGWTRLLPQVTVTVSQMWLPACEQALADGIVDVIATGGELPERAGTERRLLGSEPLLVGLRPGDPELERRAVNLRSLATRTLGAVSPALFPAWGGIERTVLQGAGIDPPRSELRAADISAAGWMEQSEVEWVLLTRSLARAHAGTEIRPLEPSIDVPYWMRWRRDRYAESVLRNFLDTVTRIGVPEGWTAPG